MCIWNRHRKDERMGLQVLQPTKNGLKHSIFGHLIQHLVVCLLGFLPKDLLRISAKNRFHKVLFPRVHLLASSRQRQKTQTGY